MRHPYMATAVGGLVGVVADTHSQDLTTPPTAEMYYSALQRPEGFSNILIRTEGDPLNLTASVRAAINRVDPTVPLTNVTTMDAMVEQSTADRRLLMAMLAAFAGLALVLASLGVYSVMAYSVGQRSGEIGVRMAMGAAASRVSQMVVSQGLRLTAIGLGLGLVQGGDQDLGRGAGRHRFQHFADAEGHQGGHPAHAPQRPAAGAGDQSPHR